MVARPDKISIRQTSDRVSPGNSFSRVTVRGGFVSVRMAVHVIAVTVRVLMEDFSA